MDPTTRAADGRRRRAVADDAIGAETTRRGRRGAAADGGCRGGRGPGRRPACRPARGGPQQLETGRAGGPRWGRPSTSPPPTGHPDPFGAARWLPAWIPFVISCRLLAGAGVVAASVDGRLSGRPTAATEHARGVIAVTQSPPPTLAAAPSQWAGDQRADRRSRGRGGSTDVDARRPRSPRPPLARPGTVTARATGRATRQQALAPRPVSMRVAPAPSSAPPTGSVAAAATVPAGQAAHGTGPGAGAGAAPAHRGPTSQAALLSAALPAPRAPLTATRHAARNAGPDGPIVAAYTAYSTYTVQPGDTLNQVADRVRRERRQHHSRLGPADPTCCCPVRCSPSRAIRAGCTASSPTRRSSRSPRASASASTTWWRPACCRRRSSSAGDLLFIPNLRARHRTVLARSAKPVSGPKRVRGLTLSPARPYAPGVPGPQDDEGSFAAGRQSLLDALQSLEQRAHDRAERMVRDAERAARQLTLDSEQRAYQLTSEAEERARQTHRRGRAARQAGDARGRSAAGRARAAAERGARQPRGGPRPDRRAGRLGARPGGARPREPEYGPPAADHRPLAARGSPNPQPRTNPLPRVTIPRAVVRAAAAARVMTSPARA